MWKISLLHQRSSSLTIGFRQELVRRLSTSRKELMRQLHSHEKMSDRKPSQFLRHHKILAPDVPDDFPRTIRARRLPPHVQDILVGRTEGRLDSASHVAEKICEVTPLPTTGSISPSTPDSTAGLLERIVELSCKVSLLWASQTNSYPHSRVRHLPHF
jgi:hypothetical protein